MSGVDERWELVISTLKESFQCLNVRYAVPAWEAAKQLQADFSRIQAENERRGEALERIRDAETASVTMLKRIARAALASTYQSSEGELAPPSEGGSDA